MKNRLEALFVTQEFVVLLFHYVCAFPENLTPVNLNTDIPSQLFTGTHNTDRKLYVQILKRLTIGESRRIAVAGRENLFLLDPGHFQEPNSNKSATYSEVYTWKSTPENRELCEMKGQTKELCYNYLSILEKPDDEHLLVCGTNAFTPTCRTCKVTRNESKILLKPVGEDVSARQRSPYSPNQSGTTLLTDGSLYTATYGSFYGGRPVVTRTMGSTPALRTSTSNVMNEPDFIKMIEDGTRVLLFFNEIEALPTGEKRTVPQVAQVCKNDVGGEKILQGIFTTFIKSRLNCSYNGFYLNRVTDLTEPITVDGKLVVYATFSTPRNPISGSSLSILTQTYTTLQDFYSNSLAGSAVCSFTLPAIQSTFTGVFMTGSKETSSIARVPPTAAHHPGLCSPEKLTDEELLFVKSHPQMKKQVAGSMLLTDQGNRWTSVYVQQLTKQKDHALLFIGTENGHLLRALPSSTKMSRGLVISDSDVYDETRCSSAEPHKEDRRVLKILIEDNIVFVAFKHCVVTVPLKSCSQYRCKSACEGAANPYCGWSGTTCMPLLHPNLNIKIDEKTGTRVANKQCPPKGGSAFATRNESVISDAEKVESSEPDLIESPVVPAELEKNSEQGLTTTSLIIAAVIASAGTIVLSLFCFIIWRCLCRRKEKSLKEKQMEEQHFLAVTDGEKRDSLSRKAQQTIKQLKGVVTKVATPELKSKSNGLQQHERRENDYSQVPTLRQKPAANNPMPPKGSKIRMSRTSSTSSRHDSVALSTRMNMQSQSVRQSPDNEIVSRPLSDAPAIRYSVKSQNDFAPSPTRSSGSYPSSIATNTVGTPSQPAVAGSATLRRREHAEQQANEIMRESGTAIDECENTLMHLQKSGWIVPQEPLQNHVTRQRLESDDSGKGESPRNSYKTDAVQSDENKVAKPLQRPLSLSVQRNSPNRRNRLLSEGSHPYEQTIPFMASMKPSRERHVSGQNSIKAQPTSPVSAPLQLACCTNNVSSHQNEPAMYGTIHRNEPNDYKQLIQPRRDQMASLLAYQQVPTTSSPQHQQFVHQRQKMQRQISEPGQPVPYERSYPQHVNPATNHYPSLQTPHHKVPAFHQHIPLPVTHAEAKVPKNHYPSLPHRSSTAPYGDGNQHQNVAFELPTKVYKSEKAPSLIRQSSMPGTARLATYVPTPRVPGAML